MSPTAENHESGTQPGSTRIVAGETGKPKRKRTLRSPSSRASCS